jgi:hypothetical protein
VGTLLEYLARWLDELGVDSFNRTFLFDLVRLISELSQPGVERKNWCACCVEATDYYEDEEDMVLDFERAKAAAKETEVNADEYNIESRRCQATSSQTPITETSEDNYVTGQIRLIKHKRRLQKLRY